MNETTRTPEARRRHGSGTLRERRPRVFEIRIAVGVDPLTRRTRQVSQTLHGTRAEAEVVLAQLLARAHGDGDMAGPLLRLDDLLIRWIEADHPWNPPPWSATGRWSDS